MAEKCIDDGCLGFGCVEQPSETAECDLSALVAEVALLESVVAQQIQLIQTQNTLLLEVNNKIINLQQDIADLKSSQITFEQYKETVPQVNDQSIFVYAIGTKVCFVAAPDMYLIVRGSRFLNTESKAYLYELYYELQVEGTEKYSLIAASAIKPYVEDSGGS